MNRLQIRKTTHSILLGLVLFIVFASIALVQPLFAHSQTWDQWKHNLEDDKSIDSFTGPPESRLIQERYVHAIEETLDPMIESYLKELDPKLHNDFLQGQILVQIKSNGRTGLVYLIGNYNKKYKYRRFVKSIKKYRFPQFPKKMNDGMIQFSHTLDKSKRRNHFYFRYQRGNSYFYN